MGKVNVLCMNRFIWNRSILTWLQPTNAIKVNKCLIYSLDKTKKGRWPYHVWTTESTGLTFNSKYHQSKTLLGHYFARQIARPFEFSSVLAL